MPISKREEEADYDPGSYFAAADIDGMAITIKAKRTFFNQGDEANATFYLKSGRAKLVVVSKKGKEATVSLIEPGDFLGEESLESVDGLRTTTALAITGCTALKLTRRQMMQLLHEQPEFASLFLKFVLGRAARTQADLVDQLFNNSEKRLARILLLLSSYGKHGDPKNAISDITQETLAEMIGTTRSRVSFFMNRFRRLGYIDYNGSIHVHKTLLDAVLYDKLPEQNAGRPITLEPTITPAPTKKRAKLV
jgi:CRP/FNR family cyclic AMP-dependent transcriptional regulator